MDVYNKELRKFEFLIFLGIVIIGLFVNKFYIGIL